MDSSQSVAMFENIPTEIHLLIVSFLDAPDIMSIRKVCTSLAISIAFECNYIAPVNRRVNVCLALQWTVQYGYRNTRHTAIVSPFHIHHNTFWKMIVIAKSQDHDLNRWYYLLMSRKQNGSPSVESPVYCTLGTRRWKSWIQGSSAHSSR